MRPGDAIRMLQWRIGADPGALPVTPSSPKAGTGLRALPTAATLGALGIVYGDIGTSPLYAFREAIKAASAGSAPTPTKTCAETHGELPVSYPHRRRDTFDRAMDPIVL